MKIIAKIEDENTRIDKLLCKKLDISFALAQKLLREKKVKINYEKVDGAYRIKARDEIEVFIKLEERKVSSPATKKISKEKIQKFLSLIIYKDENLIAINKPSGLATQGGTGIEISVDDFLPHIKSHFSATSPQLAHRIDKDTSGILLIALNKKIAEFLTDCFKNKTIEKTYLALVLGTPTKNEMLINISLKKKFVKKNEKVYKDESGKVAITKLKVLKKFSDYSLVELKPITGRTHQLRVHCKEIGSPVINDVKYGGKNTIRKDLCKRMCLHAYEIKVSNYFGKVLEVKTELPEFMEISKHRTYIAY
jgi:23S rRNA pseudouridine955/2504/2580 synthase